MEQQSPRLSRRSSTLFSAQMPPVLDKCPQNDDLRVLHDHIKSKIQQWDRLIQEHKHKQEKSFVMVFNNVLEQMKTDLKDAEDKLQSIDMLALADQHNTRLQRELHFFREECMALHAKLDEAAKNIAILKKDNQQLQEQVNSFQSYVKESRVQKSRTRTTKQTKRASMDAVATEPLPVEEEKALMSLIGIIKSEQPKAGIDLLRTFLKNEVLKTDAPPTPVLPPYSPPDQSLIRSVPTRQMKLRSLDRVSDQHSKINISTQLSSVHNEALEIWEECVKSAKSRDHHLPKFMARQSKHRLLESFFGSQKLIEMLRKLLFGEKCCNNFNCSYNIASNRPEPTIPEECFKTKPVSSHLTSPNTAEHSSRKYWGRIRRRSTQKPGIDWHNDLISRN